MDATRGTDSGAQVIAQARHLINIGRAAETVPLVRRHLASHPDDFEGQCLLAVALVQSRELASALREADRAVALNPESEAGHRIRAVALGEMGKRRQALAAAREAARVAPEEPQALYVLAHILLISRRTKEARDVAERLLALTPEENLAPALLGRICIRERRWAEAEEHLRRALEIEPDSWADLNNLGLVLRKRGRQQEAIEILHAAARAAPDEAKVRRNLHSSVARHLGGGALALWLLFQGGRLFLWEEDEPGLAILGLASLAVLVGYLSWRQRQRWRSLHPTVKRFYHSERLRERRLSWWMVGFLMTFPVGLIWTIMLITAPYQFLPRTFLAWAIYLVLLSGTAATAWRLVVQARRNP